MMDLTEVLKLEVENPATGLVNSIQNPNGELGGWGWITPLASSAMAGSSVTGKLTYSRTVAGASYFTSELMPISAGQYAAASFNQAGAGNAYSRARLEWYDTNKALLSSTAQTTLVAGSAGFVVFVPPSLAPASTAYVKLRIDLYTSGGANPAGSHTFAFNQATLAVAATAGALATIRTNLFTNPSMETNATGWTLDSWAGGTTPTLTRSNTLAQVGSWSLRLQANGAGTTQQGVFSSGLITITGGQSYAVQFKARAGTTGRVLRAYLRFTLADGTTVNTVNVSSADVSGAWTTVSVVGVAGPTATRARLEIYCEVANPATQSMAANEAHYFDAFMLEKASSVAGYFDGSTAASGTKAYSWTGTANASTSTEADSLLYYFPPVTYTDILGPSTDIKIRRAALDVGSLAATVRDTNLDPATANLLRPGRRVRCRALNDDTGLFEVLFAGETANARVAYDLTRDDEKQATITLTAYDVTQKIANTIRPQGVATINELPYVLEGAGVPWNVNGSGNQVAAATVVSSNENASALDQVALTRDSQLGYAWVTKEGVLTAYTNRSTDYYGNGNAFYDESVYSRLDVSFDTDDCINELLVALLVYDSVSGTTEEKVYGPYRDAASVALWGAHAPNQPFKVHGMAAAAIPAYAASILAANKTPALRVNSVQIPIRTPEDITETLALIDLYAPVYIENAAKGISVFHRVTDLSHDITPRRWTMTHNYAAADSVASPANTTPQANNAPGAWTALTLTATHTNTVDAPAVARDGKHVELRGFVTKTSGSFPINSTITIVAAGGIPADMVPPARMDYQVSGNSANLDCRLVINTDGSIALVTGPSVPTYVSLCAARWRVGT